MDLARSLLSEGTVLIESENEFLSDVYLRDSDLPEIDDKRNDNKGSASDSWYVDDTMILIMTLIMI